MGKLQTLEELRTRKEVEDYFKQLGKNITEEEIDKLKASYEQAEENSEALTLKQLDDVAGGLLGAMRLNREKHEEKAQVALNVFNDMMTGQQRRADLFKGEDGLYRCMIKTGETTHRDLNLSDPNEKALHEQIDQINQDYINDKKSATCSDVRDGALLVYLLLNCCLWGIFFFTGKN